MSLRCHVVWLTTPAELPDEIPYDIRLPSITLDQQSQTPTQTLDHRGEVHVIEYGLTRTAELTERGQGFLDGLLSLAIALCTTGSCLDRMVREVFGRLTNGYPERFERCFGVAIAGTTLGEEGIKVGVGDVHVGMGCSVKRGVDVESGGLKMECD